MQLQKNAIIVIGSSTGGPQTLEQIIPKLPAENIAPILVIQHMPKFFTTALAKRFDKISKIHVIESENDMYLEKNTVVIAAGDQNITFDKDLRSIQNIINRIGTIAPSIDIAMKSIAERNGENTIGIILSGMGKDGLEGARAIKAAGGRIIVQDPKSCLIASMPKSIIDSDLADEILPPDLITARIIQLSK